MRPTSSFFLSARARGMARSPRRRRRRGLANVFFFPPQPRAQLGAALAAGDLHLVTLRPGCQTVVFPSKLYGIAAVARPLVFIGPRECELAALVRDHALGFAFARDDTAAIAACLRRLATAPDECRALGAAAAEFHRQEGRPGPRGDRLGKTPRDGAAPPPRQPAQRRLMDFRLFTVQSCRDALVAVCDGWLQTGSPSPFADDTKS
jgi:hypothetical protein